MNVSFWYWDSDTTDSNETFESIVWGIEYELCYDCYFNNDDEKEIYNLINDYIQKYNDELIKYWLNIIKPLIHTHCCNCQTYNASYTINLPILQCLKDFYEIYISQKKTNFFNIHSVIYFNDLYTKIKDNSNLKYFISSKNIIFFMCIILNMLNKNKKWFLFIINDKFIYKYLKYILFLFII